MLSRTYDMLFRACEICTRTYEIIIRTYVLLLHPYEIFTRTYELLKERDKNAYVHEINLYDQEKYHVRTWIYSRTYHILFRSYEVLFSRTYELVFISHVHDNMK